jgi:multidrug resistance efflux pump
MTDKGSSMQSPGRDPGLNVADPRRALAVGLELAKNAVRARTLDELQFVLVNDTRALLPFDRALLIVHLGGKSDLAAVNNQPRLDQKSDFVDRASNLAPSLKEIRQGLVLYASNPKADGVSAATLETIKSYLSYSGSNNLIILPLTFEERVIAHLLFEFQSDVLPGEVETFALTTMLPFFSSALVEKWLRSHERRVEAAFTRAMSPKGSLTSHWSTNKKVAIMVGVAACIFALLCTPFTHTVGGRADVAPEFEYFAYVQMEGIVDKVLVKEGEFVKKDQVVAALEDNEIQYKIREQQRLIAEYKAEIDILRSQSAENPSKLADSELVAIKAQRARQELDFLKWQQQFLQIWTPVDGVVLTKKLEGLVGKRFKAGEPFCKIAPSETLLMEIFVREDDISYVKEGQSGEVFFNVQPSVSHAVRVKSIAPVSEPLERVGSVFRVRAVFDKRPAGIRPGMMGTGHINTPSESLWFLLTKRLREKLNEALLRF